MNGRTIAALILVAILGTVTIVPSQVNAIAGFTRSLAPGLDTFAIGMEENGSFNYSSNVTEGINSFFISSYNRTSHWWDTSFGLATSFKLHYGLGYFVYSSFANDLEFASYDEFDNHVNYTVFEGLNFAANPLPVSIRASEFCTVDGGFNPDIFYLAQYNSTSLGYDVYFPNTGGQGDFDIPGCSAVWAYMRDSSNINFTYSAPQ
jgi:hypothetical protein